MSWFDKRDGAHNRDALKYSVRNTALGKEKIYQAGENELTISEPDRGIQTIIYADIIKVTLQFTPMQRRKNTFRCILKLKNGKRHKISNQHYVGIANFEDRSGPYSEFLLEFHRRLCQKKSNVKFVKGVNWLGYLVTLILLITGTLYFGVAGIMIFSGHSWFWRILCCLGCFGLGATTFAYRKLNNPGVMIRKIFPVDYSHHEQPIIFFFNCELEIINI